MRLYGMSDYRRRRAGIVGAQIRSQKGEGGINAMLQDRPKRIVTRKHEKEMRKIKPWRE